MEQITWLFLIAIAHIVSMRAEESEAAGCAGGAGAAVIRALFEVNSINTAATPRAHLVTHHRVCAPCNSSQRIFMAVGLLLFFRKIFARRPMTGQPAGETERTEAVTCPG